MEKKGIDFTDSNENPRKSNVLSPWEQHASVINLPRFDYRTPSLLLESSHSGFLITCPISKIICFTHSLMIYLLEFDDLSTPS